MTNIKDRSFADCTIIALRGDKEAGKDTCGRILRDHHGFTVVSFANKAWEMLLALDPYIPIPGGAMPLGNLIGLSGRDAAKRQYPEIRRLLRTFGTEVCRNNFGDDVWAMFLAEEMRVLRQAGDRCFVITDLHFHNENTWVRNIGGFSVLVERPDNPDEDRSHSSDTALDRVPFNFAVVNDGSLADLASAMDGIVEIVEGARAARGS